MKKEFRKMVINYRKQLDPEFISKHSAIIIKKLLDMNCIKESNNIMLYLDFNNEVQTDHLVRELLALGKIVSCPITIIKEKKLIPSQIINFDTGIHIGAYGIREPKKEVSPPINIKDIDVVIVPAVAYDLDKYRLGYGGGFYDRFLEILREDAITIGIAFDMQIFKTIPIESHDTKLDYIITESRIIS